MAFFWVFGLSLWGKNIYKKSIYKNKWMDKNKSIAFKNDL